jgi:hypothetical protein
MKTRLLALGSVPVACAPAGAAAQSIIPSLIGQTIASSAGRGSGGPSESCLALQTPEKPEAVARFGAEAEPALRAYLALAAAGDDPSPAYKGDLKRRWKLDRRVTRELPDVRDPWAARVDRLEPVGVLLGRNPKFGHGIWRAYAADGTWLGTYQAELVRKTRGYAIRRLNLWSPGMEDKGQPLQPFCETPGDHEWYLETKGHAEALEATPKVQAEAPEPDEKE